MSFHSKMVKLRKMKGFTQESFAAEVGVSRQSVYKWESGQSYPEVEKLLKVARTFGVTVDDMLNDEMEVGKDGVMLTLEEFRAEQEALAKEAERKRLRREAARAKREAQKLAEGQNAAPEAAASEAKAEEKAAEPALEEAAAPAVEEKTEVKPEEKKSAPPKAKIPASLPEKQIEENKKKKSFFDIFRRK